MSIRFLIARLALGLLAAGGCAGRMFSQISIGPPSVLRFARLPSRGLFLVFLLLVSSLTPCAGLGTGRVMLPIGVLCDEPGI